MKRAVYQELLQWKLKEDRKPLILNGARQVGKTFIIKEFGTAEYPKMAFFSLDREEKVRHAFEKMTSTENLLLALSAISGIDISPDDTLVVLDEIQDCPSALTALKFLYEDYPNIHIIVAGSLLGISLHENCSFPVGKVDMIRMYPMSFEEFLLAMGKEKMVTMMQEHKSEAVEMISEECKELLRQYYFVGGMPAVVLAYSKKKELLNIRSIQKQILFDYQRDFSKHAPAREIPRINMVWNSIPSQLAKENKKFIYGALKKGARATEFEIAIQWLVDAGLIYRVQRIKKPELPLKFYEDTNAFKLFMLDIGLMGAMAETPAETIFAGDDIFKEHKGAFTELYVHNELRQAEHSIYYHCVDNSTIEIDFILQNGAQVIPVEVKAEENVKSKSLRTFINNNPSLKGLRLSMKGPIDQGWMRNLPLYAFIHEI